MTVYFIQAGDGGPVKIGFTVGPVDRRLKNLQTGHPETMRCIRTVKGDRSVERGFHQMFSRDCIRAEWFRFNEAMLTADPPSAEPIEVEASQMRRDDPGFAGWMLGRLRQAQQRKFDVGLQRAMAAPSNKVGHIYKTRVSVRASMGAARA